MNVTLRTQTRHELYWLFHLNECSIWVPVCKRAGQNEQETAETVSAMTITEIS